MRMAIRGLHLHDDDLALDVAQTCHRFVLAFDSAVIASVQVIGCKILRVFVPIAANDQFGQLQFHSLDFAFRGGIRVGVDAWLLRG